MTLFVKIKRGIKNMKKIILTAAVLSFGAQIFAGGVENKTNMSTGYLRNPSRNTECERPEAAFYNIAGTSFLDNGLYIEAGNQFIFKEYGNELDTGNKYASYGVKDFYSNDETTVAFYPDFDIVYKKDRWSIFLTFGVYAGGGALTYSEGTSATSLMFLNGANQLGAEATKYGLAANMISSAISAYENAVTNTFAGNESAALAYIQADPDSDLAKAYGVKTKYGSNLSGYNAKKTAYEYAAGASLKMAQNHSLDVTSLTLGGQLGASYLVMPWLALSAAYRYTYGTQKMILECNDITFKLINGGNKISYDANGFGQSMVFGIHAKPPVAPNLDLSLQYQTLSRIDYDVENVKGNVAQFYNITNDSKFRTDLPAVLNIGAGYRVIDPLYLSLSFNYYFNDFAHQDSILSETDYDNSWEIAFGTEYKINKYVGVSAGCAYSNQGVTDESNSTFNPVLDSFVAGGGVEIHPIEKLTVTLSGLYTNYFDANQYLSGNKTVLSKDITMFSLGVTFKPF